MTLRLLAILLGSFALSSCSHFNYAVNKETPVSVERHLYKPNTYSDGMFRTILYRREVNDRNNAAYIEHLTDQYRTFIQERYRTYETAPDYTSHSSLLVFDFKPESGVEVLVDTIVLEHYDARGELIEPSAIETATESCRDVVGCSGYVIQHYPRVLPRNITEKVSFTLLVDDVEEHVEYIFPLKYKFHYSNFDGFLYAT